MLQNARSCNASRMAQSRLKSPIIPRQARQSLRNWQGWVATMEFPKIWIQSARDVCEGYPRIIGWRPVDPTK